MDEEKEKLIKNLKNSIPDAEPKQFYGDDALRKGIKETMKLGTWNDQVSSIYKDLVTLGQVGKGAQFKDENHFREQFQAFITDYMQAPVEPQEPEVKAKPQEPEDGSRLQVKAVPEKKKEKKEVSVEGFKQLINNEDGAQKEVIQYLRKLMGHRGGASRDVLLTELKSKLPGVDEDTYNNMISEAYHEHWQDVQTFEKVNEGLEGGDIPEP